MSSGGTRTCVSWGGTTRSWGGHVPPRPHSWLRAWAADEQNPQNNIAARCRRFLQVVEVRTDTLRRLFSVAQRTAFPLSDCRGCDVPRYQEDDWDHPQMPVLPASITVVCIALSSSSSSSSSSTSFSFISGISADMHSLTYMIKQYTCNVKYTT